MHARLRLLVTGRCISLVAVVALAGCCRLLFAEPAKAWTDRAEQDLYAAIVDQPDAARKLTLLDRWASRYPASEQSSLRFHEYLRTYTELGQPNQVLRVAGEALAKDPENLDAISSALTAVFSVDSPGAAEMVTVEHAAGVALAKLSTLFQPARKPPSLTDAQWNAARANVQIHARNALGYVAWKRKLYDKAERDFNQTLAADPSQAQVSYWLSSVLLAERRPERYPLALFHMARAAAYAGPGAFAEATRTQVLASFETAYQSFHGSAEGSAGVLATAAARAFPPDGFEIASRFEVLKHTDPRLAAWRTLSRSLAGDDADRVFRTQLKDTELPELSGTILSANSREATVGIDDPTDEDVKLVFSEPPGVRLAPGAVISFRGMAKSFSREPFVVTVFVPRGYLHVLKPATAHP